MSDDTMKLNKPIAIAICVISARNSPFEVRQLCTLAHGHTSSTVSVVRWLPDQVHILFELDVKVIWSVNYKITSDVRITMREVVSG